MNDITELIKVLTTKRAKESMIFPETDENDLRLRLYRICKQNPGISDAEACIELYGNAQYKSRYFACKAHLKEVLLNAVLKLEITQPQFSASIEAKYACITKYAQAEVLNSFGAPSVGKDLMEQVLTISSEFQLTKYEYLSLAALQHYYSLGTERKKYEKIVGKLEVITKRWSGENEIRQLLDSLNSYTATSTKGIAEDDAFVSELLERASELHQTFADSIHISLDYYRIKVTAALSKMKFTEVEALAQEALAFVGTKPQIFSKVVFGDFAFKALNSALCCRRYEACMQYMKECDRYFELKGSLGNNDSLVQLSKTTVFIHVGDFQSATEICNEVMNSPYFKNTRQSTQELWQVVRSILVFAIDTEIGTVHPRTRATLCKDFSIVNFLNSLSIYTSDKSGLNILVQIMQVLLHLSQGNIEGVNSRFEALRQYRIAHVKEQEHPRSFLLMKLIAALIKSDYDIPYIQKQYAAEISRLHTTNPDDVCFNLESMELIGYDVLWDQCLRQVEKLRQAKQLFAVQPPMRSKKEKGIRD